MKIINEEAKAAKIKYLAALKLAWHRRHLKWHGGEEM